VDKKQLIKWLIPIIARGLAWFFAVKLGLAAAQAESEAAAAAQAIGALVLAVVSVYTSVKGRKKLLAHRLPD
jgi:phosphotransferase system  glucose/maltose/N-acetylglucosamine-specific IIC component